MNGEAVAGELVGIARNLMAEWTRRDESDAIRLIDSTLRPLKKSIDEMEILMDFAKDVRREQPQILERCSKANRLIVDAYNLMRNAEK